MSVIGIIAEFNPFHNGHKFLIDSVKAEGDSVICVIGDDFTQRGDTAFITKYARAEAALDCGADLCVLLPVPWSMSCANNFAIGGVSILKNLRVDRIAFGSECGDIKKLKRVAAVLKTEEFSVSLANELKKGITFALARQNAVEKLLGDDSTVLENPNDTLAVEYINAADSLGFKVEFMPIKRKGNPHDCPTPSAEFLSASALRTLAQSGDIKSIGEYVPKASFDIISRECENEKIANIYNLEAAILSHLRRLTAEDFLKLPEVSEGLENRIFETVKKSTSLDECYESIKTKRYTLARIRRIILSAYLGIDKTYFLSEVPYIKVLALCNNGEALLRNATIPLVLRNGDYNRLPQNALPCFEMQKRAADLYGLALKNKNPAGLEFTTKIIKK